MEKAGNAAGLGGRIVAPAPIGAPPPAAAPAAVKTIKVVRPPMTERPGRVIAPWARASSSAAPKSQKSAIADELAALRSRMEAKGRAPLTIDGGFAYRGVRSSPAVYEGRGGFKAWNIPDIGTARQTLKRLINQSNATNGLSGACYRWQAAKNQSDGFFLSTGTNAQEAYDTYPYVYRIDVRPLKLCKWDNAGAPFLADCVADCHLYLDAGTIDTSNFIAVICLAQGKGRIYELLIMSPCAPRICEVRVSRREDDPVYVNFDTWKRDYDTTDASAAAAATATTTTTTTTTATH